MKYQKFILAISIYLFCAIICLTGNSIAQQNEELKAAGSISEFEQQSKPITFQQRVLPQKPDHTILQSVDDPRHIEVKFIDDLLIDINTAGIPTERNGKGLQTLAATSIFETISQTGGKWSRMAGGMEYDMHRLRRNAEINLNRAIANLNNYYILTVPEGVNPEEWIDQLNTLEEVELGSPRHLPPPLPLPGNYQSYQGYLNPATNGIDANYAWSLNDSGQNVTICDFEYAWNLNHQDLPSSVGKLMPFGYNEVALTAADTNHGTAVLGVLASKNNGWGTKGAAYGATIKVAPTWLTDPTFYTGWFLDVSLTYAMTQLSRGDVFLLEQQEWGPFNNGVDTGLVPVEWNSTLYNIIITAIGNGFHVVEAGANGYRNLDSSIYNTGHAPFLPQNNSGAIIVGAGAAPASRSGSDTVRSRLSFSNYGSRLSLQGWGEKVTTTGTLPFCSALYTAEGRDYYYDSCFCGTSSASPVVAVAVALVESRFESVYGKEISPITMRTILRNTGSAQKTGRFPSTQNIGPLPNVRAAIDSFVSPTMTLSGTYTVGITGTYLDLTTVANELRQKVVTGNTIFELIYSYSCGTETFPIVFNEYTTQGGNWTVTIRPASGVTTITAGQPFPHPYTTYPLIKLDGIDRMTLDGRSGGTGTSIGWIIRNMRKDSIGAAIQLDNDATYNTLQYLQIEGQNTSGLTGTVYFGGYAGIKGNSFNTVSNCDIRDRSDFAGAPLIAIYSDWTIGAHNDSNVIINNNIYNWTGYGILLNSNRWIIQGNSFYQVVPQLTPLTGIRINAGGGHIISGNYIGGSAPNAGGGPLTNLGMSPFIGIQLSVDSTVPSSIQGNKISNILHPVGGNFTGIFITTGSVNIGTVTRNIIGDSSLANSINIGGPAMIGGVIAHSQFPTPGIVNIENNIIANIIQPSSSIVEFRGISIFGIRKFCVEKNKIHNVGPIDVNAKNPVYGIYLAGTNDTGYVVNNMVTLADGITNNCRYIGIYDTTWYSMMTFLDIQHNSVFIGGTANGANNTYGYLRVGQSKIDIKNNIFYNARFAGTGFHVALGNVYIPIVGASDYNILNNVNSSSLTQFLMGYQNLPTWQLMLSCDFNSFNANPQYQNPAVGDLHINPALYSPADNGGVPILSVVDDFDGNPRGPAPDIGADEYTINAPSAFTQISPSNGSSNQPVNGTLSWHASAAAGQYLVYLDTLNPPSFVISQTDTNYSYSGLDTNKRYYWQIHAVNSSGNIQATGSPWSFYTGVTSEVTRSYLMMDGWNMVSVPLLVDDYRKSALYPTAVSDAFTYTTSYVTKDTLENGIGYWAKFDGAQSVAFTGLVDDEDTIDVKLGWNMIGTISNPIVADSITSISGGIITSSFWGYDGNYFDEDTLVPGNGYWVKVTQDGSLILSSAGSLTMSNRIKIVPSGELPPSPPGGEVSNLLPTVPTTYVLEQNYPNPFNPITIIKYQLPTDIYVTLRIYNMLGQAATTLVDGMQMAGYKSVEFNAGNLPSGIYTYRFTAGITTEVRKMLLLK